MMNTAQRIISSSLARPTRRLVCLTLVALLAAIPASIAQSLTPKENPMKHYVMIFRSTRPLTSEEEKARPADLRQWIQKVAAMGIHLEPRNLGQFAQQYFLQGGSTVEHDGPADASIVTMVFFEAEDDDQAREVARIHPGPHYGVKIELRDWAPPQVALSK